MSKWDEYIQPEEDSEYLVYAEWEFYAKQIRQERLVDWEDWEGEVDWVD